MPCHHPVHAWRGQVTGTIYFTRPDPRSKSEVIQLPCSKCLGCKTAAAQAWALRCHLELRDHEKATFATLTYDNKHLPPTLTKRHLQLWLKRFRKALGPARPIRFFASGEYGEQTARPHYHAILYGVGAGDKDIIQDTWQLGNTRAEKINPARIAYCAGYTAKKLRDAEHSKHERVDPDTGEIFRWEPPFIQMSRRPGLGACAREYAHSWRLYAVMDGRKQPVPRYLHNAWKQIATEQEIETLRVEKKQYALNRDTSTERLLAAEQIAIKNQQLQGEKRRL
jgi:hypothetical protein